MEDIGLVVFVTITVAALFVFIIDRAIKVASDYRENELIEHIRKMTMPIKAKIITPIRLHLSCTIVGYYIHTDDYILCKTSDDTNFDIEEHFHKECDRRTEKFLIYVRYTDINKVLRYRIIDGKDIHLTKNKNLIIRNHGNLS